MVVLPAKKVPSGASRGPAVVLMSGGLDSAVAAYAAKRRDGHESIHAITIYYSQRHVREIQAAKEVAESLGVDSHTVYHTDLPYASPLISSPDGPSIQPGEDPNGIPATWVAQRNSLFLSMAFSAAEHLGATFVYAGMNAVDYSGYPDCRPEFLDSIQESLNLGSKRFVEQGIRTKLVAPLVYLSKAEIITLGHGLGVPFGRTWSCYNGRTCACGTCDSCRIRLDGFKAAGLEDPLEYES
jgi:7-cyano-7-deazaguanine synthase